MISRKSVFVVAILIVTATHMSANSADFSTRFDGVKPAVSGINGQITLGYGYTEFNGFANTNSLSGKASFTAPIGKSFGFGIGISASRDKTKGPYVAGPISLALVTYLDALDIDTGLFWRNPDIGSIGVNADYSRTLSSNSNSQQVSGSINAAAYFDRITLGAEAGRRYSKTLIKFKYGPELNFSVTELYNFVGLNATYYISKDFSVSGSVTHSFGDEINYTVGTIGATAMLPFASKNIAVFANGIFARNTTGVNTGIRIYFGQHGKSLLERDRED